MRFYDGIGALFALIAGFIALFFTRPKTPTVAPKQPPAAPPQAQPSPSTPSPKISLESLCTALRDYEGKPGDLNYQLNNPGDCRPSPVGYLPKYQPVEIIDTNTDPRYPYHIGKFAKFKTYAIGWEYFTTMVHFMLANHPTWTLIDFLSHYAPSSDKNNPNKYAADVGKRLGISTSTPLASLLA